MDLTSIVPDRVSTPAKLFLIGVLLNGLGNGIFNVILQLYLVGLGFDSVSLGTMFMMHAVSSTILTVPAGILADRYGRGKMQLVGFLSVFLAATIFLTAESIQMFSLSFLLFGVSNAGGVVLIPQYSSFFDSRNMDKAFGLLGFLNIITVSLGSLFGFIPPMLVAYLGASLQGSYWIIAAIGTVFFLAQYPFYLLSLRGIAEPVNGVEVRFNLRSKGVVAKVSLIAVIGNLGFGVFFSLFPYYVNVKFGVGSDALGTLYFVSNFVTAGAIAIAPRVSDKLGTLKTIAATLGLHVPFYLMMPVASNFTWLSALYIIRIGIVSISVPLTSSLFMRLLYDDEKATANSLKMMAQNSSHIIAPWLGGRLMEQASLDFPAYIGAGLYAATAASYYVLLRNEEEKEVELVRT